jgi:asparagine synthetase B (glutamine-hydrolysing)
MNYNDNIANKAFNKSNKKYRKKPIVYLGINPVKHLESGNIQTRTELTAMVGADYNVQYLFPFLDHNVVDFAMGIPRHLYYKNGISRYIFRKAFEGILPRDLCYYIPKDDIARCTYFIDMMRKRNITKELLEKKLSKTMFDKYIDFNKAAALLNGLREKEDRPMELVLRKQLVTVYNVQKPMEAVENQGVKTSATD